MNCSKIVILNYMDTLSILYKYLEIPFHINDRGLHEIVSSLIKSYLCDNKSFNTTDEMILLNTLEYYGLHNFESSEIGQLISNSIINTTYMYLPGFKSYDQSCALDKEAIQIICGYKVIMHLDYNQFNLFSLRQQGFMNENLTY